MTQSQKQSWPSTMVVMTVSQYMSASKVRSSSREIENGDVEGASCLDSSASPYIGTVFDVSVKREMYGEDPYSEIEVREYFGRAYNLCK